MSFGRTEFVKFYIYIMSDIVLNSFTEKYIFYKFTCKPVSLKIGIKVFASIVIVSDGSLV